MGMRPSQTTPVININETSISPIVSEARISPILSEARVPAEPERGPSVVSRRQFSWLHNISDDLKKRLAHLLDMRTCVLFI